MTQQQLYERLFAKYGNPMENTKAFENKHMVLWAVPMWIDTHIPALPNKMYVNKDVVGVLEDTLKRLISIGAYKEIKTYDGCFNPRYIRGEEKKKNPKLSIHSWGLAIDFNAAHNPLGLTKDQCKEKGLTPFSKLFDEVWSDAGWTVGSTFKRSDGMHFEYTAHL